jgi:predicted Fe-S protein YdhL (DUF1289 family)
MTLTDTPIAAVKPKSPCISICRMEESTGYCLGCGRTSHEIANWKTWPEGERDAVWPLLPARMEILSARFGDEEARRELAKIIEK